MESEFVNKWHGRTTLGLVLLVAAWYWDLAIVPDIPGRLLGTALIALLAVPASWLAGGTALCVVAAFKESSPPR